MKTDSNLTALMGFNVITYGGPMPFKEARSLVREIGLKNQKEWYLYCRSGKKPPCIPANPWTTYKSDGWSTLGDWLGTNAASLRNMVYASMREASEWGQASGIKTKKEWEDFVKKKKTPLIFPRNPWKVYEEEWKGWKQFLKTEWLPFEMAREHVKALKLGSQLHWLSIVKTNNLPKNIPHSPHIVYNGKGWVSWGDWLGTGRVAPQSRKYLPFEQAQKWAVHNRVRTAKEWISMSVQGRLPRNLPGNPLHVYKNECKGWSHFLQNGRLRKRGDFATYDQAVALARSRCIRRQKDWRKMCMDGTKPHGIPSDPESFYNEFTCWGEFLGKKNRRIS